jgi:hypothetical protein
MPPSNVRKPLTTRVAAYFSVGALFSLALPAFGHPLTVTRGTAIVADNTLTITLDVRADNLVHALDVDANSDGLYDLTALRRAAETHSLALLQRLIVRDARGEQLKGRLEFWTLDHDGGDALDYDDFRRSQVRYAFKFALDTHNDYLSFQQRVAASDTIIPSTIVLAARTGVRPLGTIRMTSRGNVEVLPLVPRVGASADLASAAEGSDCPIARFVQSEAQDTIRAIVRVHDARIRVDLFIPIRLLETWTPLHRARRDFLEADEQLRSQKEIARFMAMHNPVSIGERRVEGRIAGIEFLDVGELGRDQAQGSRRLSVWTTRARITTEYKTPHRPTSVELRWTLFNAAVLAAHALIVVDGDCLEHDLSTYDPHLRWMAK